MKRTASQTIAVDLQRPGAALHEAVRDCDLIVVEAFGQTTAAQWQALYAVRSADCYAPVVLLTNVEQVERTVNGITAGADAVIPLSSAGDVIVAHCHALMRRWRAHPSATPRFA